MKKFILFILLCFFASFLLSCHKSTLEIADEYNIDSDKSPLFEIKIGNEKVSWNEFSYFNEDELIYVYDGNICLNNVVLAEFSTTLDVIYKKNSNINKTVKINYQKKEISEIDVKILNERIYPGEWINLEVSDRKGNILDNVKLDFDKPEYIEEAKESSFKLSSFVNIGEKIIINVSVDNVNRDIEIVVDDEIYLIYNPVQLRKMVNDPYGYYKLMCDIDFANYYWLPIEKFYGVLDGNGYAISNIHLKDLMSSHNGFIIENNYGAIKNLTIKNCSMSNLTTYEESEFKGITGVKLICGGLCAVNYGLIYNVLGTSNSFIDLKMGSLELPMDYAIYCGGLVGLNFGEIKTSGVTNTFFNTWVASKYQRAKTTLGGLCGYNFNYISDCFSYDNNLNVECYGVYKFNQATTIIYPAVGGLLGDFEGTLLNSVAGNNVINLTATKVANDQYRVFRGSFIGEITDGDISNCYVLYSKEDVYGHGKNENVDVVYNLDFYNCDLDQSLWMIKDNRLVINYDLWKEE